MEYKENNIEFLTGQRTVTATFSNIKHIRVIKNLHEKYPDEFSYYYENKDGTVCAKFPLKWVKISNIHRTNRVVSDEQKKKMADALSKYRSNRKKKK